MNDLLIDGNVLVNSGRRTGSAKRTGGRIENNYYFDEHAAEFIFYYLWPHIPNRAPRILDVCSNDGILGNAIAKQCKKIKDLQFIEKESGRDALTYNPESEFDVIVSNPPWIPVDYALKIYRRCLNFLAPGGVFFFIINNTFVYQGTDRFALIQGQKYYFLPRYVFDNPVNRDRRNLRILDRLDLTEEKKQAKCKQPILLDAGILVYHDGPAPELCYNLKPLISVPRKHRGPTFDGLDE